jgi:hypothetical protein
MFLFYFLSFFVDGIVFKVSTFMWASEQIVNFIYEICVYLKLFEKSNYNRFVFKCPGDGRVCSEF